MTRDLHSAAQTAAALIDLIGAANLAIALIALNLATFALFGIDKVRAENGEWRIQESTLLGLSLIGGTVGAYAGRRLFRHKTRKQPFNANLLAITVLQVLVLGGLIGWNLAA